METRKVVSGAFKEYKAEELNDDWLWSNEESFLEPFLIRDKAGLGMKMPAGDMGIHEIAGIVGQLRLCFYQHFNFQKRKKGS